VPFSVVASLGVLHHTNNCLAGVRLCAEKFLAPGGVLFLGLYHSYGRKPFLDAFAAFKKAGASEEEMLTSYSKLSPNDKAEKTFLLSWFRDQVLHPHETQHTLAEIVPLLQDCGLSLHATSINGFKPFDNVESLYEEEKKFYDLGLKKYQESQYYPGFFVVVATKRIASS
jgi:hypothetical protein